MTRKILRIEHHGEPRHVIQEGESAWLLDGDLFAEYRKGAAIEVGAGARVLPPTAPSKIVAIGLNYKDHAAEQHKPLPAEPLVFLKPPTAVIGPDGAIELPPNPGRVDYEAELGVVIGRRAWRVPASEAMDYVLGLTCVNDVTARDMQNRGVQFSHCKGYDTFAPLGPCIALGVDPSDVAVECLVNGQTKQSSRTRELIFTVPELIAYISQIMTLLPGDVISTGTPAGVGPIVAGDRVTVRVEGVGEISNPVIDRT